LRYHFDYSYVPFETLGQTHIFSIQFGGTVRALASLSSDRERFSPHTGQVNFGLQVERMPNPGSWQLRLTDKQGLLKNEFSGQGLPPLSIEWKGRDRNDRILADGYYQGLLTVYNSSGVAAISNTRTVLLDGRPPDIRLKVAPRFLTLSRKKMALEPRLVKSLETDFINPVQSWTVKIMDQAKQSIKSFQGPGEPPATLDWNLCGEDQRPVTPGNYLALAQATDVVGNFGQSDTLIFTIGYEMQAEAKNTIKENRTGFVATLGSILFDFDRATLRPAADEVLRNLALIMTYYKTATALIGGHTDSKGSEEYNLNLSARRAEEVKRHLVEVMGISADRLAVQWFGKSAPITSNETDEGRQLNRRVEVNISLDGMQGK
jgi:outer membrane protein OmpA-like peptidoglycan-associated protein